MSLNASPGLVLVLEILALVTLQRTSVPLGTFVYFKKFGIGYPAVLLSATWDSF